MKNVVFCVLYTIVFSSCVARYTPGRYFSLRYLNFVYSPPMDSLLLPIPIGGYNQINRHFYNDFKLTMDEAALSNCTFVFEVYIDTEGKLIKVFLSNREKMTLSDKKALLIMQKIKYWKPAQFKGKNVNCRFRMPYRIHLE